MSTLQLIKVSANSTRAELEAADATLKSLKDTVQPPGGKTARGEQDVEAKRGSAVGQIIEKPAPESPQPAKTDQLCAICCELYQARSRVRETQCKHIFHSSCLM